MFYHTGSFGFLTNSVVIPVLFTKRMNNTFSRFLVFLALFDNVYVTCSVLECVRKHFWGTDLHKVRKAQTANKTSDTLHTCALFYVPDYIRPLLIPSAEYCVALLNIHDGGACCTTVSRHIKAVRILH